MNLKNEVEAEVPEICIPCDSQQRKTPAVVEGKTSLSFLDLSPHVFNPWLPACVSLLMFVKYDGRRMIKQDLL